MKTSENLKEITTALISFQSECPTLHKDREGYGYKYVTLDNIIATTKPILSKNGMVIIQSVGEISGKIAITTRLQHISGEWIEDTFSLDPTQMKGVNNVQAMGASITYGKRYGIGAILNISFDEDTDAATPQNTSQNGSKRATEPVSVTNPIDIEILGLVKAHGLAQGCNGWQKWDDSRKRKMIEYYNKNLSAGKQN